jgi:hypothetical protein
LDRLYELENDKIENIRSLKLLRKQMKKEMDKKNEERANEIRNLKVHFDAEYKLLQKIDFRRKRYIETLQNQLVMAKNVIKNPKILAKYAYKFVLFIALN